MSSYTRSLDLSRHQRLPLAERWRARTISALCWAAAIVGTLIIMGVVTLAIYGMFLGPNPFALGGG
jgi:hypothetical protein